MPTPTENQATRITNASTELAGSADGDTNEYVMRRWDELERQLRLRKMRLEIEALESGPFEIITELET